MESCWTDIVTSPDLSEWSGLLTRQQPFESGSSFAQLRDAARRRLTQSAQQYVLRLSRIAQQAGVAVSQTSVLTGDPDTQPVIMTGHQPTIFHGGLTFKYHCTEQAASTTAIGVAITIDTDQLDPGEFQYPQSVGSESRSGWRPLRLVSASFCESEGLSGWIPLLPADQLEDRVESIAAELTSITEPNVEKYFRQVSQDYCRLATAGVSAGEANSIIRWSRGLGDGLLELPLSAVCSFPEVLHLVAGILEEPDRFAHTYNRELRQYRAAHEIRNPANPFPDLQLRSDVTELPLWVLDGRDQSRHALFVRSVDDGTELMANGRTVATVSRADTVDALQGLLLREVRLIPRAAMITAFLRLLFADLFVHGTGGGHYDQFTTTLIHGWWEAEPPPFVVASASQFLFAERRTKIQELQSLNQNLRDLRFNPQRHFDSGVFSESVENRLRELCDRKQAVVMQLKSAHESGQSAKDIARRIQHLSDDIRAIVDHEFSDQLAVLREVTAETLTAVNCRTYPWFLFPDRAVS